jgi:hypothetical protein
MTSPNYEITKSKNREWLGDDKTYQVIQSSVAGSSPVEAQRTLPLAAKMHFGDVLHQRRPVRKRLEAVRTQEVTVPPVGRVFFEVLHKTKNRSHKGKKMRPEQSQKNAIN